jgi:hypothetical protein
MQSFERCRLQPVAVAQPLRDEMRHLPAEQLERAPQDDGGRNPVDIVVAVYGDPLAVGDRPLQPIDRPIHVDEAHRVEQMVERRLQEARGGLEVSDSPNTQQARQRVRHPQLTCEAFRLHVVAGPRLPDQRGSQDGGSSTSPTEPILRNF